MVFLHYVSLMIAFMNVRKSAAHYLKSSYLSCPMTLQNMLILLLLFPVLLAYPLLRKIKSEVQNTSHAN
ncbi:hypothetical protein HR52_04740 [Aeromonas hydrophila]|nr:hypothetical protein HR52_04740 [Aeromonas hydrophila]OCA67459.1 hypothetical protein A9R12_02095 [Aeromonas hydrophila]OCY08782.1 hypothetical protein A9X69_05480 [Aeromonas hydrophila]OCY08970.1 hypothetical protein A9X70_09675 [Aeromonas hydrophila]